MARVRPHDRSVHGFDAPALQSKWERYWNWDLGLGKDVHIDASRYLTFSIEAFNVFNHPNFALQAGSADISSPTTFGRIQNTFSAPRVVQLVLRFTY